MGAIFINQGVQIVMAKTQEEKVMDFFCICGPGRQINETLRAFMVFAPQGLQKQSHKLYNIGGNQGTYTKTENHKFRCVHSISPMGGGCAETIRIYNVRRAAKRRPHSCMRNSAKCKLPGRQPRAVRLLEHPHQ